LQQYQGLLCSTHCDVRSNTKSDLTVHIVMFAAVPRVILQHTLWCLQQYQGLLYSTHCDVCSHTKSDITVHIVMFAAVPRGILHHTFCNVHGNIVMHAETLQCVHVGDWWWLHKPKNNMCGIQFNVDLHRRSVQICDRSAAIWDRSSLIR